MCSRRSGRARENRRTEARLVGAAEDCPLPGRPAGADAGTFATGLLQRNATDRGLRLFLDLGLAIGVACPPHPTEQPGLDRLLELVVGPGLRRVGPHERERPLVDRLV